MTTSKTKTGAKALAKLADALEAKYFDLVWYARKAPKDDESYWGDVPADIKEQALNKMSLVEELCPDEVDSLTCSSCGDWTYGFNSGVLAAVRLLATAKEEGTAVALEEFPNLDT